MAPSDPAEVPDLAADGWDLVLDEEFDGGSLDESVWSVVDETHSGGTRRSDAVQVAADDPEDDGEGYLTLTAYSEPDGNGNLRHRSGAVTTNGIPGQHYRTGGFTATYGYMEARIRFSTEVGTNSAFWTLGQDFSPFGDPGASGIEVDIAEYQHPSINGDAMGSVLHWDRYAEDHKAVGAQDHENPSNVPLQDNFHTYGLLWTPDGYITFIDGQETWRTTQAPTYSPEWLLFTHNVKGGWVGDVPPGGYGSLEASTNQMSIDYVRTWQRPVSRVPDQTSSVNEPVTVPFWVTDSHYSSTEIDVPASVRVTGSSSDQTLLPDDNIAVTGDGTAQPVGTFAEGGFESGGSEWAFTGSPGENPAHVWSGNSFSGDGSLRLETSGMRAEQTITGLQPDTSYTVGMRYDLEFDWADEGEDETAHPTLNWGIDGGEEFQLSLERPSWNPGPDGWHSSTLIFHTGPEQTEATLFFDNMGYVGSNRASDVSIDDVYVRPQVPANRTVTLLPTSGETGEATVTLTAVDEEDQVLGTEQFDVSFDDDGTLANGSFQAEPDGEAWTFFGEAHIWGDAEVEQEPFAANQNLVLGADGGVGVVMQSASGLTPDTTYRISARGQRDGPGDSAPPYLFVQGHGGSQEQLEFTSTGWEQSSMTFSTGPDVTTVDVGFASNNDVARFDDVRLERVGSGTAPEMVPPLVTEVGPQQLRSGTPVAVPMDVLWASIDDVSSDNHDLLPASRVDVVGVGRYRALVLDPLPDRTGNATVTIEYSIVIDGTEETDSVDIPVAVSDPRLVNASYEEGDHGWTFDGGSAVVDGEGRSGTSALTLPPGTEAHQVLAGPEVPGLPGPEFDSLDATTAYVVGGWGRDGAQLEIREGDEHEDGPVLGTLEWSSSEWTYETTTVMTSPRERGCPNCGGRHRPDPIQVVASGPATGDAAAVDDLVLQHGPAMTRLRDWSLAVGSTRTDWVSRNGFAVGRVPGNGSFDPSVVEVESSDHTVLPPENFELHRPRPMRPYDWELRLFGGSVAGQSDVTVRLTDPATGGVLERTFTLSVNSGTLDNGDFERGTNGWDRSGGTSEHAPRCGTSRGDRSGTLRLLDGEASYEVENLEPGTDYLLQASAWGDEAAIAVEGSNGAELGSTTVGDSLEGWSDYQVAFTMPTDESTAQIVLQDESDGPVQLGTTECEAGGTGTRFDAFHLAPAT